MNEFLVAVGSFVVALAFIVFISFLMAWPTMMLWNECLIGAVDGVHKVAWLQAWGLNILAGIMFRATNE